MVDTSYENFYALRRRLNMSMNEATREEWDRLHEASRMNTIAGLQGMLNGRATVIYPTDVPESEVVAW
jgi:hypothetical protein